MPLRVLLLALGVIGCASAAPPAHRAEDVLAAEQLRVRAMLDASAPRLEEALHEELTYTHSNGVVETRAQLIERLRSGEIDYRSIESTGPTVRIRGASAIVAGPVRIVVAVGDRVHDLRSRYTAVYWYEDGRWRLVAYQSSPL